MGVVTTPTMLAPWIPKNQKVVMIKLISSTEGREPVAFIRGWNTENTRPVRPSPVTAVHREFMSINTITLKVRGISRLKGAATLGGTVDGSLMIMFFFIKK